MDAELREYLKKAISDHRKGKALTNTGQLGGRCKCGHNYKDDPEGGTSWCARCKRRLQERRMRERKKAKEAKDV